jgi:hypothetical protein
MSNLNSFSVRDTFYGTGSAFKLPAAFTTTTTTETAFLLSNTAVAAISIPTGTAIAGSTANDSPSGNAASLGITSRLQNIRGNNQRPYFTADQFDGRPFRIKASGYVSGGGTTLTSVTAALALYLGSSATLGSDTAIAKPTAFNIGNNQGNWYFDAKLLWDSTSQTLSGAYQFNGNNVQNITNVLITQQTSIALTSLSFVMSYSFATSSTSNTISLRSLYFDMD